MKAARLSAAAAGDDAVKLARIALAEARPAEEIIGILAPAFQRLADIAARARRPRLDCPRPAFIESDGLCAGAVFADYAPRFCHGQYGQLAASWPDLKPYYPHMPTGLKRQVDYQMGVARLNLGAHKKAIGHLWAARQTACRRAALRNVSIS